MDREPALTWVWTSMTSGAEPLSSTSRRTVQGVAAAPGKGNNLGHSLFSGLNNIFLIHVFSSCTIPKKPGSPDAPPTNHDCINMLKNNN